MPPRFRTTILRFSIKTALQLTTGVILFWANNPKVLANQPKITQDSPVCQKETLPRRPSPLKTGKLCKVPKPSETEDSGESSTKANTNDSANNTETNSDDANQDGVVNDETGLDPANSDWDSSNLDPNSSIDSNIPDNSIEQPTPSSQQDSHDINFSLDLNLGGGSAAPPDSSTDTIPPETDQADPPPINPSQNAPTSSEGGDSQQLVSPTLEPKAKKPHKNKAEKHPKKTHKKSRIKEQHPRQSHKKDHFKHKSHGDKPKSVKSRKHRSEKSLKRSLNKSSVPHRPKGDRKARTSRKHHLRTHPGRIHSNPHRNKASGSLRQRSQSHPSRNRLRRSVSPTKVHRSPSYKMSHPNRKQVRH
jgi:hypothetical protein